MIERITNLDAPPVIGRRYLVPTISWLWAVGAKERVWPVFLPLHEDARFFAFKDDHYHADPRFIDKRTWRSLGTGGWPRGPQGDPMALSRCQSQPLARHRHGTYARPLPALVWRELICKRSTLAYQHAEARAVGELNAHYAGRQCSKARSGWVCPHQHWPMGTVTPDVDGILTCPLHGLRVRAADGVVVP